VRVYVSCVIACPFEGDVPPTQAAQVAGRAVGLLDHSDLWRNDEQPGIAGGEVVLGDTIGAGTPGKIALLLHKVDELAKPFILNSGGPYGLGLHLHDTFGRAADCVREALKFGVRSFDGSAAGLGGCPYASTSGKRAPGNISTELLVRTIHEAGYESGVDLDREREAAAFAARIVDAARAGATS
jgi:hydroxymethylglutaryl-CoA lyase